MSRLRNRVVATSAASSDSCPCSSSSKIAPSAADVAEPRQKKQKLEIQSRTQQVATHSSSIRVASHPPPSISSLDSSTLQAIFHFCGLNELATITKLNRGWKQTVKTLKSFSEVCVTLTPFTASTFAWPPRTSALLPHVNKVSAQHWELMHIAYQCELLRQFPNLEKIDLLTIKYQIDGSPFKLPTSLKRVSVRLDVWALQSMIDSCKELPQLTSLQIEVSNIQAYIDVKKNINRDANSDRDELVQKLMEEFNFGPLLTTPLTEIALFISPDEDQAPGYYLTRHLLSVVKRMPLLRNVDFPAVNLSQLWDFIQKTPFLSQLQSVQGDEREIESESELNVLCNHFPSLTSLGIITSLENCALLCKLPRLQHVQLQFSIHRESVIPPATNLMRHLAQLRELVELDLCHPTVTGAHLCELVPHLLKLETFHLTACQSVRDLRFLRTPSLAKSLRRFSLWECPNIASTEVMQLRFVTKLHDLTLNESFDKQFCAAMLALFEPNSEHCILPALKSFYFTARDVDEEGESEYDEVI